MALVTHDEQRGNVELDKNERSRVVSHESPVMPVIALCVEC